ncbi:MAG: hypothetical protein JWQ11_4153 [Rhizobacter sp.]|nr:hypothetical protein [Rhizobacter sp.]
MERRSLVAAVAVVAAAFAAGKSSSMMGGELVAQGDMPPTPLQPRGAAGLALEPELQSEADTGWVAVNAGGFSVWGGHQPFIDVVPCGEDDWALNGKGDKTCIDAHGWIVGLPPKAGHDGVSSHAWSGLDARTCRIKAGTWVVTWSGDAVVDVDAPGLRSKQVMANGVTNRITFHLPQVESNGTASFLRYSVTNPTKAPVDCRDIRIFHAEHEPALKVGRLVNPDYIAALPPTLKVMRFMDWLQTNNNLATGPEHLATTADRVWIRSAPQHLTMGVPPSVVARTASEIGCDLWVTLGAHLSQAGMDAFAREIAANYPKGRVRVEFSNELWNAQFEQNRHMTVKAAEMRLIGYNEKGAVDAKCLRQAAEAHGSLQCWAAFEKVLPRERVVRQYSSQVVWFENSASAAFEYVDPGLIAAGRRMKELCDSYAIAPYMSFLDAKGEHYSTMRMKVEGFHRMDEATLLGLLRNGISGCVQWVRTSVDKARRKNPALEITSYEGGQETYVEPGFAGGHVCRIDRADNTLDFGVDITSLFDDGDAIEAMGAVAPIVGLKQGTPLWVRKTGRTKLRLYSTLADYDADANAGGAISAVLDGPLQVDFRIENKARINAIIQRLHDFWDGGAALYAYREYWNAVFRQPGHGLRHMNQYFDFGGYGVWFGVFWGVKAGIYWPDTPRSIWFRALP